jgi:hypothetical protein
MTQNASKSSASIFNLRLSAGEEIKNLHQQILLHLLGKNGESEG